MISWAWTVFPVSIYEAYNTTITIKAMSSGCIQTAKIYHQLYLDILLSSAACKEKLTWKFLTLKKKLDFQQREIFLRNLSFSCFFVFTGKLGTSNTTQNVQCKQNIGIWLVKVKKHTLWFQAKTTNNRGCFLIKNQNFL